VVVCMYVVSLGFMACLTLNYLLKSDDIRALSTLEVEETLETLNGGN
jgi:hypothetical protein